MKKNAVIAEFKAQNIWFIQKIPISWVGSQWPNAPTLFPQKNISLSSDKFPYQFGSDVEN